MPGQRREHGTSVFSTTQLESQLVAISDEILSVDSAYERICSEIKDIEQTLESEPNMKSTKEDRLSAKLKNLYDEKLTLQNLKTELTLSSRKAALEAACRGLKRNGNLKLGFEVLSMFTQLASTRPCVLILVDCTASQKIEDKSIDYIRKFVHGACPLTSIAEFKLQLIAELPDKILVRPGIFPNSTIFPFEECNNGFEDMDVLYCLLKSGYEQNWMGGSETDVTTFAMNLTAQFWIKLSRLINVVSMVVGQNLIDASGATESKKRPDFCLWMDGALILMGEAKRFSWDLVRAKRELTAKMNVWNTVALRGLSFLPCFAIAGSQFQICAISYPSDPCASLRLHECSEAYDMIDPNHRLWIMRISLNMLRCMVALRSQMPQPGEIMPLYLTQDRGNDCSITIMNDHVVKVCNLAPSAVYDLLKESSPLPCAVTVSNLKHLKGTLFKMEIRPVCLQVLPSTQEALRSAVFDVLAALVAFHGHGFVHRDIRWPNILKSLNGWLLADFELASREGEFIPDGAIAQDFLPPEVVNGNRYMHAGDIYAVGRLLIKWHEKTHILLSDEAITWSKRLTAQDPAQRPTAKFLVDERGTWLQRQ